MTILMKGNKQLVITEPSFIYQKENVVDSLLFYIPAVYKQVPLDGFSWTLTYLDSQGERHTEMLNKDEEIEKENFLAFRLPVDTEVTRYIGTITMSLSGVWVDPDTLQQYVIKSSALQIEIHPLSTLYEFTPDESFDGIDQRILELNAKIQAVEAIEERLNSEIPDDLSIEDQRLYLMIDGEKTGDGVEVLTNVQDVDGDSSDGIIDLNNVTGDEDIDDDEGIAIIQL